MNHARIPTGRQLLMRRIVQRLLDPNPNIDMSLISGGYLCLGVWCWYFGIALFS